MYPSTICGPTLSPLDKVATLDLPELNVGDWLFFRNRGDYTETTSTSYNSFSDLLKKVYFASESKRYYN